MPLMKTERINNANVIAPILQRVEPRSLLSAKIVGCGPSITPKPRKQMNCSLGGCGPPQPVRANIIQSNQIKDEPRRAKILPLLLDQEPMTWSVGPNHPATYLTERVPRRFLGRSGGCSVRDFFRRDGRPQAKVSTSGGYWLRRCGQMVQSPNGTKQRPTTDFNGAAAVR